jgi:hypothetical protein
MINTPHLICFTVIISFNVFLNKQFNVILCLYVRMHSISDRTNGTTQTRRLTATLGRNWLPRRSRAPVNL